MELRWRSRKTNQNCIVLSDKLQYLGIHYGNILLKHSSLLIGNILRDTLSQILKLLFFGFTASNLFKMMLKYRPEDKAQNKERLLKRARAEAEGKTPEVKKPIVVKYGLNHVTYLIEQNNAQLVVIAHDVDPIELVVWLPALCRKMEIPYCIVKGKARLGTIVHKKTAYVLCLTSVKNEDKMEFSKILEAIKVRDLPKTCCKFSAASNKLYLKLGKSGEGVLWAQNLRLRQKPKKNSLQRRLLKG
ncbi:uncharacterized protein [Primulina eburnea]|uniref:uncharacterized protein n=1 Tax=Primulina eburnea TaxID=1245227 RepID=UPI003C6C003F